MMEQFYDSNGNSSSSDNRQLSGNDRYDTCGDKLPTPAQLLYYLPIEGLILAALLILFSLLTLIVYIEEIIFIRKHIRRGSRTMWVLACYPVYSTTSILAVFVPRCGAVNDLVASTFFATCLYNFGRLMIRYMGGTKQLWKIFEIGRLVSFRTLPVCCCCICFPSVSFSLRVYNVIRSLVMQVAIVRPILAFISVMLHVEGSFKPSGMSYRNPYSYLTVGDIISTMLAVYGLMILRGVFRPELEQQFKVSGKIMSVQLALICSVLPKIIINILVANNVIQCGPVFPSSGRGEMIHHAVVVLVMLPLSLLAQRFFRRSSDSDSYFDQKSSSVAASVLTTKHGERDEKPTSDVKNGSTALPFMVIADGETNV